MRYFEDFILGTVSEPEGWYELTAEEIIEFCEKWDPLPFHVDPEAAEKTPVGALFTSAIHTVAIAIKLGHLTNEEPVATEIGLGWDDVRFFSPARAGDRFRIRAEVTETRVSESKPHLGIVGNRITLINQDDEKVISFKTAALFRRRPQEP